MKYLRRQWLLIVRKSYHSLCLFLVAFFFACFTIVAAYFGNIVDAYQELVVQDIGYVIHLTRTDEAVLPQEAIEEVLDTPGVSGINCSSPSLATPLNFSNSVDWGESEPSVFDQTQSDKVKLIGNLCVDQNITLQVHGVLVEGRYPDSDHPGMLISEDLAESNDLSVGDHLSLLCEGQDNEYSAAVVGIYQITSPIQETTVNAKGYEEYGTSPYSYIFCDLSSFEEATGLQLDVTGINVYAKNRRELKSAYEKLSGLGYNAFPYSLYNTTEDRIETGTLSSRSITVFAQMMSWVTNVTALLVVFLLILLWMRNNYKDISILISMGKTRFAVALDYFILCNIIICIALLLAGPLCFVFIKCYGNDLLQYAMDMMRDSSMTETDVFIQSALSQNMNLYDYIRAEFELLAISWLSIAVALTKIFRCKPTVLFRTD